MLEDMLRGYVMEFPRSWDRYIPLMEFSYNKSYQTSISMAPYDALYGWRCRKDIEYELGDKVFLKASLWRKVLRFGKKGKLSLRFIGPYEVLERIEPVAYRFGLSLELAKLHDVFHVSMLWRYR